MSFNIDEFRYIACRLEEILAMIVDNPSISLSAELVRGNQTIIPLKLSFALRHGFAEIIIKYDSATFSYFSNIDRQLIKELKFNDSCVDRIEGSFNFALKEILIADKENNPTKAQANINNSTLDTDTELDRVRAELSGIN